MKAEVNVGESIFDVKIRMKFAKETENRAERKLIIPFECPV